MSTINLQSKFEKARQSNVAKFVRARFAIKSLLMATAAWGVIPDAWTQVVFQQVYAFPTSAPGPWGPATRLVEATNGNFYGTTSRGGLNDLGTVFTVTPAGALTTLLSFTGSNGRDPNGGLVLGQDGNFYGTTAGDGGITNFGTVFKMTPGGVLNTLASFHGTNGNGPFCRLEPGSDGNFYGTTSSGGAFGFGTVFVVSTNGVLTSLLSFSGTNGCNPHPGLLASDPSSFYGVTPYGGSNFNGAYTGNGTVFKITTNGVLTTLVYFNLTNGSRPMAALARGSDGNVYGTTARGGANDLGTIFRLSPGGLLTTLVDFGPTGGVEPFGGITQANDGDFYGTTGLRLENSVLTNGTVFKMTTNGLLTTLVNLNGTNGLHPFTDLMLASDGNVYGAMADIEADHSVNGGTLFRLAQPPVITTLTSANGSTTVSWFSFRGGTYWVQRNASLAGTSWTPLSPTVTAAGPSCSFTEPVPGNPESFYRVVLLP